MKLSFLLSVLMGLLLVSKSNAQVTSATGTKINNDPKSKFNKMLGADESFFYAYRLKKEGEHYLEKYDNQTMALVSSKLIDFSKEDKSKRMRLLDIVYSNNNYYVFKSYRSKDPENYHYCYEIIDKNGVESEDFLIFDTPAEHAEFKVDYNKNKTKIAIATTFYLSKEKAFTVNLSGLDLSTQKTWSAEVFRFPSEDFLWNTGRFDCFQNGIWVYIDEFDNIHFTFRKKAKNYTDENPLSETIICTYDSKSKTSKTIPLGSAYTRLTMNTSVNGELNLSGFIADDYNSKADKNTTNHLTFLNIKINTLTGSFITNKKEVTQSLIDALEAYKNTDLVYTMRDFFNVGTDTYFIGEQALYKQVVGPTGKYEPGLYYYKVLNTAALVVKINSKKEVQWISQIPTRFFTNNYYNNIKQFITAHTDKTLYIFNNEHEDNLKLVSNPNVKPSSLKDVLTIFNSTNFVYTSLSLSDGKINNHDLVFKQSGYGFHPYMGAWGASAYCTVQNVDLSVPIKTNALIIHTDDQYLSRFVKINFE